MHPGSEMHRTSALLYTVAIWTSSWRKHENIDSFGLNCTNAQRERKPLVLKNVDCKEKWIAMKNYASTTGIQDCSPNKCNASERRFFSFRLKIQESELATSARGGCNEEFLKLRRKKFIERISLNTLENQIRIVIVKHPFVCNKPNCNKLAWNRPANTNRERDCCTKETAYHLLRSCVTDRTLVQSAYCQFVCWS